MALHEVLGEGLGGLEPGAVLRGTEDAQAAVLEDVHDAGGKGVIGADDGEVDLFGLGEPGEGFDIGDGDGKIAAEGLGAGIARGAKEVGHAGRLAQLPTECVLAAAAADDEDFHGGIDVIGGRGERGREIPDFCPPAVD